MLEDTIAAIATPLGEGGLAVIRLSGPQALALADRCFAPAGKSSPSLSAAATHTIHYGKILRRGQVIDEVLVSVMRAPRTFTREDIVEVSCHGGLLPAKLILDTLLEQGIRLAQPGEFTRRAFLNGRIDLTQAEAVADLIHSRTELALTAAQEQLAGHLSRRINELRDEAMAILAHVEAHIDFPEEDIAPATLDQLLSRLNQSVSSMDQLLRTAEEGRVLRCGIRAAIIGRPNAGKSSLLNQLLGQDRAIVTSIAGTTRDTIEETANIRGLPVILVDTAGLRTALDEIEEEGVRRSHSAIGRAELILHVFDGAEPLTAEDQAHLNDWSGRKRILIRNKADLPQRLSWPDLPGVTKVDLSCKTGSGLDSLKNAIKQLVWSGEISAEMLQVMVNSRHQDALRRAREGILKAVDVLGIGQSLELAALDLHLAVHALGEIVGKTTTEDLLDAIFSQFCIGK